MKLMLDTNAYCAMMRSDAKTIQCIEAADEIYLPSVVLGELYAGFRLGNRYEENMAALNAFLQLPGVEIIDIDQDIADRYSIIFKCLKEAGTPIPTNDLWIAACSLELGARLLAKDRHFQRVAGLLLIEG